ncbi:hypothetical protein MSIBF_A2580003 [groundwater metagenome]|uniref:Uncharacterized protein n=1 Tax=groundwater metagenome TaxID=717931 RepID=A0A098E9F6_9ZZZZ
MDDKDEDDDEESAKKFQTIVGKQAVQILHISNKNINEFVLKVQKGQNITREDVDKAQNDTVATFYMSMLLSDDSNLKNKKAK